MAGFDVLFAVMPARLLAKSSVRMGNGWFDVL